MTTIFNVADLVDPATGNTYRQDNAKKVHNIPLGSIVEIRRYNWQAAEHEDSYDSLRLRVLKQGRDCDQTPLYWLGSMTLEEYQRECDLFEKAVVEVDNMRLKGSFFGSRLEGGYAEESLKVIRLAHKGET